MWGDTYKNILWSNRTFFFLKVSPKCLIRPQTCQGTEAYTGERQENVRYVTLGCRPFRTERQAHHLTLLYSVVLYRELYSTALCTVLVCVLI